MTTSSAKDDPIPLRILVVEDTALHQMLANRLLAKDGHEVTLRKNGKEAVTALDEGLEVDLVLMDVDMPVMDGLTATQQIRTREGPAGRHRLIIALTASSTAAECEAAGMDAFLSKPLTLHDLYEIIEHCKRRRGPGKPR